MWFAYIYWVDFWFFITNAVRKRRNFRKNSNRKKRYHIFSMCCKNWYVRLRAFSISTKINANTYSLAYDAFRSRAFNIKVQLIFARQTVRKRNYYDISLVCVCVSSNFSFFVYLYLNSYLWKITFLVEIVEIYEFYIFFLKFMYH